MNIYALKGFKVIVTERSAKNGYDSGEHVRKYLTIGKEYAVEKTEVHSFSAALWLQEVPGVIFNPSNFEDVSGQSDEDNRKHPGWED